MAENNRILIIDDDPGVRDTYRTILSPSHSPEVISKGALIFGEEKQDDDANFSHSYDLTLAENGEKGIIAVESAMDNKRPFACAFIDMKMPGIDGAETAKRISSIDKNIKLVIVTAFSEYLPEDIIRITQKKDLFYLRKPFNPAEIRQFSRSLTAHWNLEIEKKELSDQLEKNNNELERKVKEQAGLIIETERKQAEKEKAAVYRELQKFIETANAPIFGVDKDGLINEWNKAAEMITGLDKKEALGMDPLKGFISEKQRGSMENVIKKALAGTETANVEISSYSGDGKKLTLILNAAPRRNAQGNIVGVLGVAQDITERVEYQGNLERLVKKRTTELNQSLVETEQSRDRVNGILMSVADGLLVTDKHQRVVLMNSAVEDLLDVHFSKLSGRPIDFAINDKGLLEHLTASLQNQEKNGTHFDFERPGDDPERTRVMHARSSPIIDKNNRKTGIVTIISDITREREIERMKTEFIYTAAHELRTPLTSIQGYSELLVSRDDIGREERKKFLSAINKQAMGLAGIVSDLMDLSCIESGREVDINKKPCIAGDAIRQMVPYFKESYPNHNFEVVLPEEPVELFLDKEKMAQVLGNLVSNAAKFSPEGETIFIKGEKLKSEYMISVQDQGIGMTPEQVDKIFDRFYRVDASHKGLGGIGLGVTIAKIVVEAHGGKVWVESELGKGTTVKFVIPIS